MATNVRGTIVSAFKLNGLSLKSEATKFLTDVLSSISEEELDDWLDKIVEATQKQPLKSSLVDREIAELAVEECNREPGEESDKAFCIIDAFDVPRFTFNSERKKFIPNNKSLPLHADSEAKAELFLERLAILNQRTLRHELFSPVAEGAQHSQTSEKFSLRPVEYLLGSTGSLQQIIVLGMLTQIKEGQYYLEDGTGSVPLDLSKAAYHNGLYTENCFVLAEGSYEDGVFQAAAMGFPPAEPSRVTRANFGNINFFGGPSQTCAKASRKLEAVEKEHREAMFVVLSDVWLDKPKVMAKLKAMFTGYSSVPPAMFVFCGNFTSEPYGPAHYSTLKKSFQSLANLIGEFPSLMENSRFVFVPGPQDPGPGNILPRPPLPACLTNAITQKVPMAIFATNPCRIQYCTQEILVFREDLVAKMCRNALHLPENLQDIPSQLVKTILAQAHLCPLPLHVRPMYWSYDHTMRVYPVPDVVILADKHDPFTCTSLDCNFVNPGSFARSDFSFKVYWPATRDVDDCKIQEWTEILAQLSSQTKSKEKKQYTFFKVFLGSVNSLLWQTCFFQSHMVKWARHTIR